MAQYFPHYLTATIASGQTVGVAFDTEKATLVGLQFPTMTGTTMTFQVSADNTTYTALKDTAGASVSITIASTTAISIDRAVFQGWRWIKLVSGSAEGAARSIIAVMRVFA